MIPRIKSTNQYLVYIYIDETKVINQERLKNRLTGASREMADRELVNQKIYSKGVSGTLEELIEIAKEQLNPGDCLIIVEITPLNMTEDEHEFLKTWLYNKKIPIHYWENFESDDEHIDLHRSE
jgi:hypothetical protein